MSHTGIDNVFQVQARALEPSTLLNTLLQPIQERLRMLIADQLVTSPTQVQDPLVSKTPRHDRHQRLLLLGAHLTSVVELLLSTSPPQPTTMPQQPRRVDPPHLVDKRAREIRAPQERPPLGLEPGLPLAQPRPIRHDAHIVRTAYRHHGGREARIVHDDVPRRVAPQGYPEHDVLDNLPPRPAVRKDVRGEVVQQHARVDSRAREAAKHVLCVRLVAAPPRLVRDGLHKPTAVVPLVESDCNQALFPPRTGTGFGVVVVGYDVCREWGHARLRLEPRVQEP